LLLVYKGSFQFFKKTFRKFLFLGFPHINDIANGALQEWSENVDLLWNKDLTPNETLKNKYKLLENPSHTNVAGNSTITDYLQTNQNVIFNNFSIINNIKDIVTDSSKDNSSIHIMERPKIKISAEQDFVSKVILADKNLSMNKTRRMLESLPELGKLPNATGSKMNRKEHDNPDGIPGNKTNLTAGVNLSLETDNVSKLPSIIENIINETDSQMHLDSARANESLKLESLAWTNASSTGGNNLTTTIRPKIMETVQKLSNQTLAVDGRMLSMVDSIKIPGEGSADMDKENVLRNMIDEGLVVRDSDHHSENAKNPKQGCVLKMHWLFSSF
jgi:hypothetical protein